MPDVAYERPAIVRNPIGLMNKVGRRADLSACSDIDGVPVPWLCARFGSPLFVFSERRLRARAREARDAFRRHCPDTRLCWSYKTNYLDAVCAVFHAEGSLAEVVSGMEYDKARRLGVPGDQIVFNGPAKSRDELERAVAEGAILHADHLDELRLLDQIAEERHTTPRVGIRVSVDAGIHPRWDRFGFTLENGDAMDAVRRLVGGGRLRLGGLHTHLGTFVLEPAAYARATTELGGFADAVAAELGTPPTHLDLGACAPPRRALGEPCTLDADCASERCLPQHRTARGPAWRGGTCTELCDAGAPCPTGATCAALADGQSLCAPSCGTSADCRAGYVCSPAVRACLPDCRDGWSCGQRRCDETTGACR